jgi:hypothetical protein
MVTNEQIRRARPTVDSPLGRLIKGEISQQEYQREAAAKYSRNEQTRPTEPRAAQGR